MCCGAELPPQDLGQPRKYCDACRRRVALVQMRPAMRGKSSRSPAAAVRAARAEAAAGPRRCAVCGAELPPRPMSQGRNRKYCDGCRDAVNRVVTHSRGAVTAEEAVREVRKRGASAFAPRRTDAPFGGVVFPWDVRRTCAVCGSAFMARCGNAAYCERCAPRVKVAYVVLSENGEPADGRIEAARDVVLAELAAGGYAHAATRPRCVRCGAPVFVASRFCADCRRNGYAALAEFRSLRAVGKVFG